MAVETIPYLSSKQYLEGEQRSEVRHEYIRGSIFAMAGASDEHGTIVVNAEDGSEC